MAYLFVCLFVLTTPGMPAVVLLPPGRLSQGAPQSTPGVRLKKLGAALPTSPLRYIALVIFCFVLFVLQLSVVPQWAPATTAGPFPTWDSGLRLKTLDAALPLRPSQTANADGL